jgi:predicted nucleic acid-binding protein
VQRVVLDPNVIISAAISPNGALDAARELLISIEGAAELCADPSPVPRVSRDPDDDYLLALSRDARVDLLVSGDGDLLAIADHDPPIVAPRSLLDELDEGGEGRRLR